MDAPAKRSRLRLVVLAIVLVMIGFLLVAFLLMARHARHSARRLAAYGRLSQMRMALVNYETVHGTLPPLSLCNKQGKPIQGWRALILPFLDVEPFKRFDLSQPWNSDDNRKVAKDIHAQEWTWFARDDRRFERPPVFTHILALLGEDSIWDAATGLPKGTITARPKAILLISVPESNIEPLEPRDITEDEVRKRIEDGQEVLFILACVEHGYGVVPIEGDKLAFHTWQEVLDREGRSP